MFDHTNFSGLLLIYTYTKFDNSNTIYPSKNRAKNVIIEISLFHQETCVIMDSAINVHKKQLLRQRLNSSSKTTMQALIIIHKHLLLLI